MSWRLLAAGELCESQTQELVPTKETPHKMLAIVTFEDLTELIQGNIVRRLRKDGSAKMHAIVSAKVAVSEEIMITRIQWISSRK